MPISFDRNVLTESFDRNVLTKFSFWTHILNLGVGEGIEIVKGLGCQ